MDQHNKARLKALLMNAGICGIPQQNLTFEMRNHVKASDIKPILEQWRKLKYVQKFTIPNEKTRPTTIWRATEEILKLEV